MRLAVAALIGASLTAISALYIHMRSVDQILDRLIERRKFPTNVPRRVDMETEDDDEEDDEEDDDSDDVDSDRVTYCRIWKQSLSRSLNDCRPFCYRVSSSMPNVVLSNQWLDEEAEFDRPMQSSV